MQARVNVAGNNYGIIAGNVHLEGGSSLTLSMPRSEDEVLEKLQHIAEAAWNANDQVDRAHCLEGTRAAILDNIRDWIHGSGDQCVFWLYGSAGVGKSTVARTICHEFSRCGLKAGVFLSSAGRGADASLLVQTLASQLAYSQNGNVKTAIADAVRARPALVEGGSMLEQWRDLIEVPLSLLDQELAILVIDALDECHDVENVEKITSILLDVHNSKQCRVRILVTSRPDIEPKEGCLNAQLGPAMDQEVGLFLSTRFREIRERRRVKIKEWPSTDIMQRLIELTNGLFIYASTLCDYLADSRASPCSAQRALTLFLESTDGMTSERGVPNIMANLDKLYSHILARAVDSVEDLGDLQILQDSMRQVLSYLVALRSPLSRLDIAQLASIEVAEIENVLWKFTSVLSVPEDESMPVTFHHQSFRSFLQGKACTEDIRVSITNADRNLTRHCFKTMFRELKKYLIPGAPPDISRKYAMDTGNTPVTTVLAYACCHWAFHQDAGGEGEGEENEEEACMIKTQVSFRPYVLDWIQALSWLDRLSNAVSQITKLLSSTTLKLSQDDMAFLRDTLRFILRNAFLLQQFPMQVYSSALVFSPESSAVRKEYLQDNIPTWLVRLPQVPVDWGPELSSIETKTTSASCVSFSGDSTMIAMAMENASVCIWSTTESKELRTLYGHDHLVTSVCFSCDDKRVASGSYDNTIRIWDWKRGQTLRVLKGHTSKITSVALSNTVLASASFDKTVRIWCAYSGIELRCLGIHSDFMTSVNFSSDGMRLVSASADKTIHLYDVTTGRRTSLLEGHDGEVLSSCFIGREGLIASASEDCTVCIWDPSTREKLAQMDGHRSRIHSICASRDGKLLASGSADGSVRIWDVTQRSLVRILKGHSHHVRSVAFSHDTAQIVSASFDSTIRMWDVDAAVQEQRPDEHADAILSIVLSNDGKVVASASRDWTIGLWHVSTGELWKQLVGHDFPVSRLAFSGCDGMLVSASDDGYLIVWDLDKGDRVISLQAPFSFPSYVDFSEDNKRIAAVSLDDEVFVWDLTTEMAESQMTPRHQSVWPLSRTCRAGSPQIHPESATSGSGKPSVNINEQWLERDGTRLLYVPFEHEEDAVVVREGTVIIGAKSGGLVILAVRHDN